MHKNKLTYNKLFSKDYFLLWQGQFVSRIGSQIYLIAMIIWIKDSTDSAGLLGLMGFIGGLPALIFAIIGGTFADRHSRKNIIIASDVINGLLMLILAYLLYVHASSINVIIYFLMFSTILTSIVGSFFSPAISAAIPDIVGKDNLTMANSWSQGSQQIVTILGLGLGGILYVAIGVPLLVLLNGVSFMFSAFSEMFITIPQVIPEKAKTIKEQFNNFIIDIKSGFKYIWERTGLRNLVLTSVLTNFFSVPIALLLPFYIDSVLHVNESWLGYLLAIGAIGSIFGYVFSGLFKLNQNVRLILIFSFIFIDGIFYVLLGTFSSLFITIGIMFFSGIVNGFVIVHIQTILQLTIESNHRGRIFGFIGTISGALIPLSMGLFGYLADLTNKNISIIYTFSGFSIVLVSLFIIKNKDIKSFLQSNELIIEEDSNKYERNQIGLMNEVKLNNKAMEQIKGKFKSNKK